MGWPCIRRRRAASRVGHPRLGGEVPIGVIPIRRRAAIHMIDLPQSIAELVIRVFEIVDQCAEAQNTGCQTHPLELHSNGTPASCSNNWACAEILSAEIYMKYSNPVSVSRRLIRGDNLMPYFSSTRDAYSASSVPANVIANRRDGIAERLAAAATRDTNIPCTQSIVTNATATGSLR